ncbi:hypothetical protein MHU86_3755 [Fragilaria crotonensis]|nr:hypothetical protein MHU86_3755 [Fragilaria crotonensis]
MSNLNPPVGRVEMTACNVPDRIERTIKFQFNDCRRFAEKAGPVSLSPFKVHVLWMKAVQDALGDTVELISNKNRRMSTVDTVKWSNPNLYKQHFHIHKKIDRRDNEQRTTFYLVHRIRTQESIDMIKRIPRAFQILKEHNCYLHEHYWGETVWDCQQLGFIVGLDYRHYEPEEATKVLIQKILQQVPKISRKDIPQFRLVLSTPTVRHPDRVISTTAYAVEVQSVDNHNMGKLLRTAFRGQKTFVSFKMRYSCLTAFENAIKYQNLKLSAAGSPALVPPPTRMANNSVPPVADHDHGDTDETDDDDDDISSLSTAATPGYDKSQLAEHRALVEQHKALLAEHRARMEENEARMAANEARMAEHKAYMAANEARMAEHRVQIEENNVRVAEIREMLILLLRSTLPPVDAAISHG